MTCFLTYFYYSLGRSSIILKILIFLGCCAIFNGCILIKNKIITVYTFSYVNARVNIHFSKPDSVQKL